MVGRDGSTTYIGEALLRACGGGWHLDDIPDFDSSGLPFVTLDTVDRVPITEIRGRKKRAAVRADRAIELATGPTHDSCHGWAGGSLWDRTSPETA